VTALYPRRAGEWPADRNTGGGMTVIDNETLRQLDRQQDRVGELRRYL
jgi:hypothetical protein